MDLTRWFGTSESNYINHTASNTKTFNLFSLSVLLYIPSILFNGYVIYIALGQGRKSKRQKKVTSLTAHLSFVAICAIVSDLLSTSIANGFLYPHKYLCGLLAYWKDVFTGAFSLNNTLIVREQYQSTKPINETKGSVGVAAIVWLVSMMFNIPAAMMTKYTKTSGESNWTCEPINLMKSPTATLVYEGLRFTLFSLIGTPYIVYLMTKMRAKLKYLRGASNSESKQTDQQIQTIQQVYFHLRVKAFLWIPWGLVILALRAGYRQHVAECFYDWSTALKTVYIGLVIFNALFSFVSPCMSLFQLRDKNTKFKFDCCTFKNNTCISENNCPGDIPLVDLNQTGHVKPTDCTECASSLHTIAAINAEQQPSLNNQPENSK